MLLNRGIALAGLLASVAGSGCSQPRSGGMALADTVPVHDSVALKLEAPAQVAAGAPVQFRLTLSNPTDRQVTLYLLGREISFDIIVMAPDGGIVWRRMDDSPFQDILAVRTLAPHQEIVLQSEWRSTAPNGNYTATATVFTDQEPLRTAPVRFAITGAVRPLAQQSTAASQDETR